MIFLRMASFSKRKVNDHWQDTMLVKSKLSSIQSYINSDQHNALKNFGSDFYFWGDTDATLNVSDEVRSNSKVIFYGEKVFHTLADVSYTFRSKDLAEFFWPPDYSKNEKPWLNIYAIKTLKNINIAYDVKDYKKRDGSNRELDKFRSGGVLKSFQKFNLDDPSKGIVWHQNKELEKIENDNFYELHECDLHNGKGLKVDTPIKKAWIYKISYEYAERTMVYIGQDILCDKDYKSSSNIFWFVRQTLGLLNATSEELEKKINYKKEIIAVLTNTTKGNVNKKENEFIEVTYEEAKKKNFIPINYTGSNSPKYR